MDIASTSGTAEAPPASSSPKKNKPKYSRFTQQELPACKPLLTPKWVLAIFMSIGIVFIPIGVAALIAARDVVEMKDRYDKVCNPLATRQQQVAHIQSIYTNKQCLRTFQVSKKMKSPIYVYYELDNFYQNHRRYVKSRSDLQLLEGTASPKSLANCDPAKTLNGQLIVPCGLVAWSLFNDTYSFQLNGQALSVNKAGISWKSDREHKFGKNVYPSNFPNNLPSSQNGSLIGGAQLDPNKPLSEDEDLIVWMRTAALPNFRKLWGKIEQDLDPGDLISVDVSNVYNTYSFGGKKSLVLSTTTWIGGKNYFLGAAYIVVGALSILLALLFFVLLYKYPRPLGDTSRLSWNKDGNTTKTAHLTG